ncbi:MAG TPA: sucrase ferredoxin [Pseudonocardiaceae bacterium]
MRKFRCATAAELAGDPLEATAPPADLWLLVEHAGPWGRHAITESKLQPSAAIALAAWTTASRARVALIRRPGAAHRNRKSGRWYLADARPGREGIRSGTYTDENQLIDVIADHGRHGEPSAEPIYLVCTHGRHDTCCALRGRPVANALARAFPHRTWECTHVGGDRFAANLVMLPHGIYYGQVTPREAVDLAKQYQAGALDLERLRGRSSLPAPVQAAQHHARLASGETSIDGYPAVRIDQTAPTEWRVLLAAPDGRPVTVTVRAAARAVSRPLTCAGPAHDRFRIFELVDLRR